MGTEKDHKWGSVSWFIWWERHALLGAVAFAYPRPFLALPAYLAECPLEDLQTLGDLLLGPHELHYLLEKSLTHDLHLASDCVGKRLTRWAQRAWKGMGALPSKWNIWAFPILAVLVYMVKDLKGRGLLEEYLEEQLRNRMLTKKDLDVYVLAGLVYENGGLDDDDLALFRLLGVWFFLPPPPLMNLKKLALACELGKIEDPPPLYLEAGETETAFLKRANAHHKRWAGVLNDYVLALPAFWPTRQRDLLFLAWREVGSLSYKAIADRAQDYLESDHPIGKVLAQGWGEAREALSEDVVAKAVRRARKRLAIW